MSTAYDPLTPEEVNDAAKEFFPLFDIVHRNMPENCKVEDTIKVIMHGRYQFMTLEGIQQLRGPNFNQFRPPNPLEWTSDNVDFLLILPHLPT